MVRKIRNFICLLILGIANISPALTNENIISQRHLSSINFMLSEIYHTTIKHVTIENLQGGFSGDQLYLISHDKDKIVVRIHKKNKSFKDKQFEWEATKIASDLDIGPRVLFVGKNFDLVAIQYIQGQHPSSKTFAQEDQINNLLRSLIKLHNGPHFSKKWSVFEYIKERAPKKLNDKEKLALAELNNIQKILKRANFELKPCHNDIQPYNLLLIDNKTFFIDWGDAGMSDPFWDLARISMEFVFNSKQDDYLLNQYLGRVTKLDKSRFFIMKQVFLLRSAFLLKTVTGGPDQEKLKDILKIFKANNYALNMDNTAMSWHDVSRHAMNLFIRNSRTDLYLQSLKTIDHQPVKRNF